jgi:hypothetical protein
MPSLAMSMRIRSSRTKSGRRWPGFLARRASSATARCSAGSCSSPRYEPTAAGQRPPLEVYGVMGAERDGLILSTRQARQLGGGIRSAMCCDPVHRVRRACRRRPSGALRRAPATGANWLPVLAGRGRRGAAWSDGSADGNASRCPSRKATKSLTSGISRPAASAAIALASAWPSPIGARLADVTIAGSGNV